MKCAALLLLAFSSLPAVAGTSVPIPKPRPSTAPAATAANTADKLAILDHYRDVDPKHEVPRALLAKALLEYDARRGNIKNPEYLSVIDYSKPSSEKRFYIIQMKTGKVWKTYVANGKGSEPNKNGVAKQFGNEGRSHRSSIGVFMTQDVYYGKHGKSLRLAGLSATNSAARARAIVIHGASYVQDKPVVQGRSWGCPAVPMKYRETVINMLKGGSLILATVEKKK
jgi:hypothetical protein